MVDGYLTLMVGALRSAFPTLSIPDAYALTMEGLKDTSIWTTTLNDLGREAVDKVILKHDKNATDRKGSYCP